MISRHISLLLLLIISFSCKDKEKQEDVSIGPGSAVIINGGDNNIDVIDLKTLELKNKIWLKTEGNTFAHHIYFSGSKGLISIALPFYDFSNGHDGLHNVNLPGKITVLNSSNTQAKITIDVPKANHNAVISPDESEVWTAGLSHSGRVYVYSLSTGALLKEVVVDADPSEIIFSADGKYAVVACGESSFVTVIDSKTKVIVKEIKVDLNPGNVWPGFGNNIFVENSLRKTLNIVDLNGLFAIDYIDFDFTPGFPVYNEKTQEIWVCSSSDDKVYFYKKMNGIWAKTGSFQSSGQPHQIAFIDDFAKAILINQKGNTAKIIDVTTRKELKSITTGKKPNGIAVWE